MTAGIIVGRFQVPFFHPSHQWLISLVRTKHETVGIYLGCCKPSKRNPLDFHTRRVMIKGIYPEIVVNELWDVPNDDAAWSKQLDEQIQRDFGDAVLYGGRESFIPRYSGKFKTHVFDHIDGPFSGTDERAKIGIRNTIDFRAGVIYAANQFAVDD